MAGPDTTALWSEFHRPLGAFLAKRVRRDADVDDLLQEVFVRIHKRIDTLERADRIDAWIFQIALPGDDSASSCCAPAPAAATAKSSSCCAPSPAPAATAASTCCA